MIKEIRKKLGLTQPEMAKRLGISERTLQSLEADPSKINPHIKKRLHDLERTEESFAGICQRLRTLLGLTRQQIADRYCIDKNTWGYWESGKQHPSLENRQKVLAILREVEAANREREENKEEKIRIYRLSKNLNVSNDVVMAVSEKLGIKVSNPSNAITISTSEQIREYLKNNVVDPTSIRIAREREREDIAQRIKYLLEKGETIDSLAKKFDVTERTIRNWLNGDAGISETALKLLEKVEKQHRNKS